MNNSYPRRILYRVAKLMVGAFQANSCYYNFRSERAWGRRGTEGGTERKRKTEEKVHSVDLPTPSIWVNV